MQFDLAVLESRIPRVVKHIIFWLAYATFFATLWGSLENNYQPEFIYQFLHLPEKMFATYLTLYWLLPNYLLKQRYLQFFIYLVIILFVAGFALRLSSVYIEHPLFWPESDYGSIWEILKIIKGATGIYPVVAIAALIKLLKVWYKDQQKAQNMAKEKLEAELKFLKAQIHPHFLFNTLNNLYALTLKKSNAAPEVVLKLSELLNYMLYECNAPRVPLKKEIELVQNYIDLEKMRYDQRLEVKLDLSGEISGLEIAPMLILPFVENSFKHGVSSEIDKAHIGIEISVNQNELFFQVENSKEATEQVDSANYKEGIGLKNVKRRLELLYQGKYELKILDSIETYLTVLRLKLK